MEEDLDDLINMLNKEKTQEVDQVLKGGAVAQKPPLAAPARPSGQLPGLDQSQVSGIDKKQPSVRKSSIG